MKRKRTGACLKLARTSNYVIPASCCVLFVVEMDAFMPRFFPDLRSLFGEDELYKLFNISMMSTPWEGMNTNR